MSSAQEGGEPVQHLGPCISFPVVLALPWPGMGTGLACSASFLDASVSVPTLRRRAAAVWGAAVETSKARGLFHTQGTPHTLREL